MAETTSPPQGPPAGDPGLVVLVMLLRFHGIGADPAQIHHQFGSVAIGMTEMLRCAKEFGLKARTLKTSWDRLAVTPLPAIATLKDGGFLLLAKAGDDKVIVQSPNSLRPELLTRAEFEARWDGLSDRHAPNAEACSDGFGAGGFDISWFLGAVNKYRRHLRDVLIASFFLQLFALVSPLIFQVVIDKVLVHRSMSTLDVLVLGLVTIAVFETITRHPAHLPVFPHHQPGSMSNSGALRLGSSILLALADRLFPCESGSETPSRASANWKTSGIFSPVRR